MKIKNNLNDFPQSQFHAKVLTYKKWEVSAALMFVMSFINKINNRGPNTEPFGTPIAMDFMPDK